MPGTDSHSELCIVSDTDRDGTVRFDRDIEGKAAWTRQRGAIFMCNNDSDRGGGEPDHADTKINGSRDLLDLTVVKIKRIPGLDPQARLYLSVSPAARPFVRLFYRSEDQYIYINVINREKCELPARLLRDNNLELRIEATSYACPGWDGSVTITAFLEHSGRTRSDSVQLKVAPFILLSAVQPAQRMYVRDYPGKNEALLNSLKEITEKLGVQLKIIAAGTYNAWNIWLQDVMEVGYSRTPNCSLHVVLNANRGKSLDVMPKQEILAPDHGWFRVGEFKPETGAGRGGDSWLDWYGNLEVTPPLPGKPFGRIVYGYNKHSGRSLNPQIVALLEAQQVQTPLVKIHTGWLLIKHVDEIFNFVPVKSKDNQGKTFKVLVPDVTVAYKLLDHWNREGKGHLKILRDIRENETVASLVNNKKLREYNFKLQAGEIKDSIDMMKQAIGIDEGDIIHIPALFNEVYGYAGSLMPNMVNSVHMNGHQVIADPRGPQDKGKDLFQEYVAGQLAREHITALFVDDMPYHKWGGNVHCATNVTYRPHDKAWWR
jgi:protein-arginine deiminase